MTAERWEDPEPLNPELTFGDLPDEGRPDYALRPPPPVSPNGHNLRIREKVEKAWNARVAGGTWQQCADVAGYASATNAQQAVKKFYGELPVLERDELRNIWRDRLELTWRMAVKDMAEGKPGAVTAAVRVATCAAQLDGLNPPVGINLDITHTFEQVLTQLNAGIYGD